MSQWLTVEEAAAALGVSKSHIYRCVASNKVPHIRIGDVIRINLAGLKVHGCENDMEVK